MVLELARTLPNPMPGPSLAIALFDGEEARGQSDFSESGDPRQPAVRAAGGGRRRRREHPPLKQIRAMVLFDMVGDCDLQIPREFSSSPRLYAPSTGRPAARRSAAAGTVLDDHTPFQHRGIPAVDLIDFTYGSDRTPGPYWHTTEDTLDKVCPASLDAVGDAALEAIPTLP